MSTKLKQESGINFFTVADKLMLMPTDFAMKRRKLENLHKTPI